MARFATGASPMFLRSKRDPGSLAAQALARILALYAIEDEIRGQPHDLRRAQRQPRAGPLLKAMRTWLEELLPRVSAKSEIDQAIGDSLGRWTALTRYVDDGRLEIDNSAAARALRGVSLGRKNYRITKHMGDGLLQSVLDSLHFSASSGIPPSIKFIPAIRCPIRLTPQKE